MGLIAKAPGVDVSFIGVGPWMVYVWAAPKDDWFDLHIETDHPNDYHATLSFVTQGRVSRFNRDDPANVADQFMFTTASSSRDLGDRKMGFWRNYYLDDDTLFYQVKLVRPRRIDDAFTTHPICERVTLQAGDIMPLEQGDMMIPVSGSITVNSSPATIGEATYADHPSKVGGSGVLEYFHA